MEVHLVELLSHYGVLGLWTASLLYTNNRLSTKVVTILEENNRILEAGYAEMDRKHQEERRLLERLLLKDKWDD